MATDEQRGTDAVDIDVLQAAQARLGTAFRIAVAAGVIMIAWPMFGHDIVGLFAGAGADAQAGPFAAGSLAVLAVAAIAYVFYAIRATQVARVIGRDARLYIAWFVGMPLVSLLISGLQALLPMGLLWGTLNLAVEVSPFVIYLLLDREVDAIVRNAMSS